MAYLLSNTVTWSQAFVGNLDPTVYAGSEPALTAANMILSLIMNPPFTWAWNRASITQVLTPGQQDYAVTVANFGFLEKTIVSVGTTTKELDSVYNSKALGATSEQSRPEFVAVQSYTPTTTTFRFLNAPDQAYTATFIFQQAPNFFTATSQDWNTQTGIPYSYIDVFNNLFLSDAFNFSNDERSAPYRQRGMAALLSKAEGLTEMQRSEILGYSMQNDLQTMAANLRTQQASQARGA